jgi:16S rRNA processing protein RimM
MGLPASPEPKKKQTGSPPPGEPVFLVIGLLRRSHGLHGDVIMDVYTDFPERLVAGKTVLIGESHRPMVIRNLRPKDKELIIGFEGYDSPESTVDLRNQKVYISSAEIPALPDGEYYHHQLIGLRVVNPDGEEIGMLDDILETRAHDVYVVKGANGEEHLIPAVDEYILEINIERQVIKVTLPDWG